jgi:outer membrane lipoprotein SlyB
MKKSISLNFLGLLIVLPSFGSELIVSQHIWQEFTISERATITDKFPYIEIISSDSIGLIHSVQIVNRSTNGTSAGTIIGSAAGQAVYVDKVFRGDGNNYSAVNQVGAALLGALLGSTLDQAPQQKYEFNYAIKNPNGNIREQRFSSSDEFTKPVGQCVLLPELRSIANLSCSATKNEFLKLLSTAGISKENTVTEGSTFLLQKIACRLPGVGLMTLDRKTCSDMEGKIE